MVYAALWQALMRSGAGLFWSLSVAWLGADAFIQPRHHAIYSRTVQQHPERLFSQPEDRSNEVDVPQRSLSRGGAEGSRFSVVAGSLLGLLGPLVSPASATMDAPRLFGVQVPRSVYVAWQELEQASGPLRARLDDIMVQSNVIGPDGKKTVDFETLGRLLGREAEGLLLQARSQIESIDLPSLSLDRSDVEGALAEAVATAETALQRLDGPLLWGDRNLQEALGSLPPTLASHESVQGLLTFLKLVATNPAVRLQTEGVLSALLGTIAVLLSIKALQPPISASARLTSDPLLPTRYDVAAMQQYYGARPSLVLSRIASALSQSSGFLLGLASDYVTNRLEVNEAKRATQLKELITALGPVFIKVGQLMSVRPDLLGPEYLRQLQLLQDQVPAFSSADALRMVEAALPPSMSAKDVFKDVRAFDKPIAAASLGQVYRATLQDGSDVAVKVQRPRMLEAVTMDLFASRLVFSLGTNIGPVSRQCREIIAILDTWGSRFIQELDYLQEAENSKQFADSMQGNSIINKSIVVPRVYDGLTSRGVLVTEWIEGRKLSSYSKDVEEDRTRLNNVVQVLLNSYLIQLLETGFLHSDPHPGNFLLTSDNRLCILDFGLMTSLEEDKRVALVEYVAHLTAKDYNATVVDLVRLGFIPEEIARDEAKRNIVAPVLGEVLEQLSAGGGAKAVNVEDIGNQVEILAKQYPLTLPAWFALIIRTFSALEGLGLSLDDKYSIVNGCYPYLARRLLTDDSPRIRAALRSFLYGSDNLLKVERVNEMVQAYRDFNEAFGGFVPTKATPALQRPAVAGGVSGSLDFDESTVEALKILFAKDDNYVQQLVVEEAVRMTDAAIREVTGLVAKTARATPLSLLNMLPGIRTGPLGGLITLPLLPLITLLTVFSNMAERAEALSQLNEEDRESLKTLRRLLDLLSGSIRGLPLSSTTITSPLMLAGGNEGPMPPPSQFIQTAVGMSSALAPYLSDVAPGAVAIGRKFLRQLTGRILTRLADELAAPQ